MALLVVVQAHVRKVGTYLPSARSQWASSCYDRHLFDILN